MTNKAAHRFLVTATLLLFGSCSILNAASAPNRLSYQGTLTDNNGNYLTGDYDFRFEIYEANGTLLWPTPAATYETQPAIPVTNGIYNIEIGSFTVIPTSIFSNNDCYLQIYVRKTGNPTFEALSPRQHLLPSPYAANLLPGVSVPDYDVRASTGAIQAQLNAVQASTGTSTIDSAVRASTGTLQISINNIAISTGSLKTQLNAVQLSTFTVASLNLSQYATTTDTGTLKAQINSLGISTGSIQTLLLAVQQSTGTTSNIDSAVRTSTGIIQTQLDAVQLSTFTVASLNLSQYATTTDTGTLKAQINSLGISTGSIQSLLLAVQQSTGTSVIDSAVRTSTGIIQTQLDAVQLSTFTVASLNLSQYATTTDTGTLNAQINSLGISTGSIQTLLLAVQQSTGTSVIDSAVRVSTGAIQTQIDAVQASTFTVASLNLSQYATTADTGTLKVQVIDLGISTGTIIPGLLSSGGTFSGMVTMSSATVTNQFMLPQISSLTVPSSAGLLMYDPNTYKAYISTATTLNTDWIPLW